jgi:phage RecT family recombinase
LSQQYFPQARGQQAPAPSVENQIMQMKQEFARAIGGATPEEQQRRAERFARVCVTAFRQTPKLQMCSPGSILGAMMTCAQLDLEPNTPNGLAYLIPYGRECQFQIGYKGLLQLMYRSGAVASFNADVVFKQEVEQGLFKYTSGIHPDIHHEINLLDGSARSGNPADIVAAYACCVLKSGEPIIRLVTRKEIDQLTEWVKRPQVGAKGLVYVKWNEDGSLKSSVDKFYTPEQLAELATIMEASKGDMMLLLCGPKRKTQGQLGVLRLEMGERLGYRDPKVFAPLWIVDFPLLEWSEEDGRFYAMHHPFTAPKPEHEQ